MKAAVATAKGRVPVLSGVAEYRTADGCRYAADMEKLGADGLMVLPAMVYKSDARETLTHFRSIAKARDLPIMVYNNPNVYGVDITPEMFAELAEEQTIVATQESSAEVSRRPDIAQATVQTHHPSPRHNHHVKKTTAPANG